MNENISDLSLTNDIIATQPSQTDSVIKYDLLDVNHVDIVSTAVQDLNNDTGSEEIGITNE